MRNFVCYGIKPLSRDIWALKILNSKDIIFFGKRDMGKKNQGSLVKCFSVI